LPQPVQSLPNADPTKRCWYHQNSGHTTGECIKVCDLIENLIRSGSLNCFIQQSQGGRGRGRGGGREGGRRGRGGPWRGQGQGRGRGQTEVATTQPQTQHQSEQENREDNNGGGHLGEIIQ